MLETLLLLLTSHLLGDFVFQPDALIARKKSAIGMALNLGIVAFLAAIALSQATAAARYAVAVIAITHLAMDLSKTHLLGDKLWAFFADQAVHLAVIIIVAWIWPALAAASPISLLPADIQSPIYAGLALLNGLIIGVPAGGIIIRKLVEPIAPASPSANPSRTSAPPLSPIAGMPNAGRYIGWLERGLTIAFLLIKQPEAIGFLLAAKSILRFRDIQDQNDRHQAEYIIIGTFLSFGWGLLVALGTRAAMDHWLT